LRADGRLRGDQAAADRRGVAALRGVARRRGGGAAAAGDDRGPRERGAGVPGQGEADLQRLLSIDVRLNLLRKISRSRVSYDSRTTEVCSNLGVSEFLRSIFHKLFP